MMWRHLLGLVLIALCQGLEHKQLSLQIGVKQCKDFCKNFCGCVGIEHSFIFLRCTLLSSKCELQKMNNQGQALSYRRISTRTRRQAWVEVAEMDRQAWKIEDNRDGRMLIAMKFTKTVRIGLFEPSNQNVRVQKFCVTENPVCILYIRRLNIILISDGKEDQIKTIFPHGRSCIDTDVKISCSAMQFHHRLQRVVVVGVADDRGMPIYTMPANASDFRLEFSISGFKDAKNMALDDNKDLIYVLLRDGIISVNLQEDDVRVVTRIHDLKSICLDGAGNIMYFSQERNVVQLNPLTKKGKRLNHCPEFKVNFSSIELFSGKMFLSFWQSPFIGIIEDKTCNLVKVKRKYLFGVRFVPPV